MTVRGEACLTALRRVDEMVSAWKPGTILAPEELARAARFAVPGPAQAFIAGRLLLRNLVSRLSGCRPEDAIFRFGTNGKPMVEFPVGIEVTLTHSGNWVLAAAGGQPLGIDMEVLRPLDWPSIARRFLTDADRAWLDACAAQDRHHSFFRLWTWKEAVAKAIGVGLPLFSDLPLPRDVVEIGGSVVSIARLDLPSPLIAHLAVAEI